jgi:hypothetical protein
MKLAKHVCLSAENAVLNRDIERLGDTNLSSRLKVANTREHLLKGKAQ